MSYYLTMMSEMMRMVINLRSLEKFWKSSSTSDICLGSLQPKNNVCICVCVYVHVCMHVSGFICVCVHVCVRRGGCEVKRGVWVAHASFRHQRPLLMIFPYNPCLLVPQLPPSE